MWPPERWHFKTLNRKNIMRIYNYEITEFNDECPQLLNFDFLIFKCLSKPAFKACIICNDDKHRKQVFKRFKDVLSQNTKIESLVSKTVKNYIEFLHWSSISFSLCNDCSMRGCSFDLIWIADKEDLVTNRPDKLEEFYNCMIPVLHTTKGCLIS